MTSLNRCCGSTPMSTVASRRDGVVLERARRELDVADLLGEHPPVVLALEQALDLALRVLGDVGAVGVEEADHHPLADRRADAGARVTPAGGPRRAGEEAGDRQDATSRSSTSMPAALRPAIIARLSMRAARLESRDVTTVVPLRRVVP